VNFSRLSFYHIQRASAHYGLSGLVGCQRGPQAGLQIDAGRDRGDLGVAGRGAAGVRALVERVAQRFQGSVHPRSIERTLARRPQKGGTTQVDQVDQRSAIHLP
jgi:hypothetical protein